MGSVLLGHEFFSGNKDWKLYFHFGVIPTVESVKTDYVQTQFVWVFFSISVTVYDIFSAHFPFSGRIEENNFMFEI